MTLADFEPLTEAEEAVIAGLGTGHVTVLGDGRLPDPEAGDDRRVRASLIRWLALGAPGDGGVRLHEKGLRIAGALVIDESKPDFSQFDWRMPGLNLESCVLSHDLFLCFSFFVHKPMLHRASLQSLYLGGSRFPGLDAEGLKTSGILSLVDVTSEGETLLNQARVTGGLNCFRGKFLNRNSRALVADSLYTEFSVDLENANVDGETSFILAEIGGDLNFTNAKLNNEGHDTLSADRIEIKGDCFLNDIQVRGKVRFLGARIPGAFSCDGGFFKNPKDIALSMDGAKIKGAFFWREGIEVDGAIDLTAAEIGHFNDDPDCWPKVGDLVLDRCRYGAFVGTGINAGDRIRWLDLQDRAQFGKEFWPQPWEYCAHVLREMGHAEDARAVLIAKEERQRRVRREIESARLAGARLRKRFNAASDDETRQACAKDVEAYRSALTHKVDPRRQAFLGQVRRATGFQVGQWRKQVADYDALMARVNAKADRIGTRGADAALAAQSAVTEAWCKLAFLRLRDWLLGALIAYGHRPLRALGWLAGMWLVGAVLFGVVHGNGGFKPNNAFILSKPEWFECATGGDRRGDHPSTLACYQSQPEAAGYPAFHAALYSIDTLVPVVDLEVQDYWVPDERVSPAARTYLWVHIAMGWFLALLAVAGVSGLIDTRATKE